jgi:hypothetical protein
MYVIVASYPYRPPAVYGPVEDRHPPAAPEPAPSILRVPLHPATTRLGTTPANPALPGGWPRTVHAGRRLAAAITGTGPPPEHTTPVVLLLASPTRGLLTAIGPFTTTAQATTWLDNTGDPGGDITATVLPLHTPVIRPPWTTTQRRRRDRAAGTGQHEQPLTAPRAAPTALTTAIAAGSPPSRQPTTPHRSTTT